MICDKIRLIVRLKLTNRIVLRRPEHFPHSLLTSRKGTQSSQFEGGTEIKNNESFKSQINLREAFFYVFQLCQMRVTPLHFFSAIHLQLI